MAEAILSLMFFGGIFLLVIILASIRLVNQYERGVVFRLGRVSSNIRGPGIHVIWPVIDRMVKVTMQTVNLPVN